MHDYMEWRIKAEINYLLETKSTIRAVAKEFCVSKSTVHQDLKRRIKDVAPELQKEVNLILLGNKEVRHLRGGEATRRKFKELNTCRTRSVN